MIIVEQTGPLALLEDRGRPGYAHLGVSPSGAADRAAFGLANRMLGNRPDDAAIETVGGGLRIAAVSLHWVVVTGAPTRIDVNGVPSGSHACLALQPGDRLTIHPPRDGLRNYLAVRGGIEAPRTLGSRSRDLLSGLGPEPLTAGQRLTTGQPSAPMPDLEFVPVRPPDPRLGLLPGPRLDWFTDEAWQLLLSQDWTVSPDADRVGVRLVGPELTRRRTGELPPEGLLRGAIQVPAAGQPLIFGADHPVTGGYPVIAVLTERAADSAAQLRPGQQVRFALDSRR